MFIIHKCYKCDSTDIKWSIERDSRFAVFIKMECQGCDTVNTKCITKGGME